MQYCSARRVLESHGLVPWIVRLVATHAAAPAFESHGLAPWIVRLVAKDRGAANVNLHGASPWHPARGRWPCSSQREPPRGKPVASQASSVPNTIAEYRGEGRASRTDSHKSGLNNRAR